MVWIFNGGAAELFGWHGQDRFWGIISTGHESELCFWGVSFVVFMDSPLLRNGGLVQYTELCAFVIDASGFLPYISVIARCIYPLSKRLSVETAVWLLEWVLIGHYCYRGTSIKQVKQMLYR